MTPLGIDREVVPGCDAAPVLGSRDPDRRTGDGTLYSASSLVMVAGRLVDGCFTSSLERDWTEDFVRIPAPREAALEGRELDGDVGDEAVAASEKGEKKCNAR